MVEQSCPEQESDDDPEELFSLAIGLVPPWLVDHVTFTVEEKRMDLHINFPKDRPFACSVCGEECPVHDTHDRGSRKRLHILPRCFCVCISPKPRSKKIRAAPMGPTSLTRCAAGTYFLSPMPSPITSSVHVLKDLSTHLKNQEYNAAQ